jgi:signal transduction histidine kinase
VREQTLRQAIFLVDATRLLASLDVEQALAAVARLVVADFGAGCAVDLFEDGVTRRVVAISRDRMTALPPEPHPSAVTGRAIAYLVDSTSCIGVPLVANGVTLGVMTLTADFHRKYHQADLELAEELGRRAALAIDNARLYQQAQDALRSRDEFLSVASHEIRGPITSLHLAVQMLRRGQIPKESQPRAFDIIERENRRLTMLVDELLDLSRIRADALHFEFEQVDLGEIAHNVASRLAPELERAKSSVSITIAGQVRGEWDRIRLDQVVTNLMTNAIKFGLGKPISVEVAGHEDTVVLSVTDQGIGIAADVQVRIFQPFERGVSIRHYGGLGLGLYIVRTIVEGLGGRVGVVSKPDEGSTFTVELPRVRRAS